MAVGGRDGSDMVRAITNKMKTNKMCMVWPLGQMEKQPEDAELTKCRPIIGICKLFFLSQLFSNDMVINIITELLFKFFCKNS